MALACGLLLLYAGVFFTEGMRPVDMSAMESEDLGACKKRKGSTPGSEIWCRCNHQGGPIVSQEACEDNNGDRKTKCQWDEEQLKCLPTAPTTSTSEDIFSEIHEVSENLKNDDTNMSLRDLITNTTSTTSGLHWLHPWHAVNYVGSWVSPSSSATTTTTSEVLEVMQRELNFEPGKMKSLPQSSEKSEDLMPAGGEEESEKIYHATMTSSEASDVTSSEASDVYTTTELPEIETTMTSSEASDMYTTTPTTTSWFPESPETTTTPELEAIEEQWKGEADHLRGVLADLRKTAEKEKVRLREEKEALDSYYEELLKDSQMVEQMAHEAVASVARRLDQKKVKLEEAKLAKVEKEAKKLTEAEAELRTEMVGESAQASSVEAQLEEALANLSAAQDQRDEFHAKIVHHKAALADQRSTLVQCKVLASGALDDIKHNIDDDLDDVIGTYSKEAAEDAFAMAEDDMPDLESDVWPPVQGG
mmetsp:Transcript_52749/g.123802  ORF Transcript_52749/g.123802 Transcript_52749/m.123802 type:complete len:477 (+) Transcript_52749:49-1479(+)